MAKLIYSALQSLDGFVADTRGEFDWAEPDEQVHWFINNLERSIGTYLCGRRLYDVMQYWETARDQPDQRDVGRDYAEVWCAAEKVVYSRTLEDPPTARTRVERSFDPGEVAQLKASSNHDLSIGGATLAAEALRAGLVDELNLFIVPVVVGGGTPFLPDGLGLRLALLDDRRFDSGIVHLHYRVQRPA